MMLWFSAYLDDYHSKGPHVGRLRDKEGRLVFIEHLESHPVPVMTL